MFRWSLVVLVALVGCSGSAPPSMPRQQTYAEALDVYANERDEYVRRRADVNGLRDGKDAYLERLASKRETYRKSLVEEEMRKIQEGSGDNSKVREDRIRARLEAFKQTQEYESAPHLKKLDESIAAAEKVLEEQTKKTAIAAKARDEAWAREH